MKSFCILAKTFFRYRNQNEFKISKAYTEYIAICLSLRTVKIPRRDLIYVYTVRTPYRQLPL